MSESYREREKARARFKNRGKRRRFFIGAGAATIGFTVGLAGVLAFQSLYVVIGGYALTALCMILLATGVVPQVREWHYSGSVAFGIVGSGPPPREIDEATRRTQLRDAEAWAGQAAGEADPVVKIRCLGCERLNDEDARFCQGCGGALRA